MIKKCIQYFVILSFVFVSGVFAVDPSYVTFSFSSDDFHNSYTFYGGGDNQERSIRGRGIYDLVIDLNEHNTGGLVTFLSTFNLTARIIDYKLCEINNGYIHQWTVNGSYIFRHYKSPNNETLLTVKFRNALLTSWSPTPDKAGPTMTLQDSRYVDSDIAVVPGKPLVNIGIKNLDKPVDFAFTLTHIVDSDGDGLLQLNDQGAILEKWNSEGSYSSSVKRKIVSQLKPDLIPLLDPGCEVINGVWHVSIKVKNQGSAAAGPTATVIDFGTLGTVSVPTPAININQEVPIQVIIPDGCFNTDCEFRVKVDAQGDVDESIETNNDDGGTCMG